MKLHDEGFWELLDYSTRLSNLETYFLPASGATQRKKARKDCVQCAISISRIQRKIKANAEER